MRHSVGYRIRASLVPAGSRVRIGRAHRLDVVVRAPGEFFQMRRDPRVRLDGRKRGGSTILGLIAAAVHLHDDVDNVE